MLNSLVWLKENVEDNQELRDYVDWKDWQRQKEDIDERHQVTFNGNRKFQRG